MSRDLQFRLYSSCSPAASLSRTKVSIGIDQHIRGFLAVMPLSPGYSIRVPEPSSCGIRARFWGYLDRLRGLGVHLKLLLAQSAQCLNEEHNLRNLKNRFWKIRDQRQTCLYMS